MKKVLCLIFYICFFVDIRSLASQSLPKIEIGTIASLAYKNGGEGESPLRINEGDGTFVSQWVLLFGAEISDFLSLYAEMQTMNGINFLNYGLSAIYSPGGQTYLNAEVGKFLVPFGTFLSRRWASENPFIDFPLIYEYRTGLSAFDLPRSETELLGVRGKGQSFQYHRETSTAQLNKSSALFSGHIPRSGRGLRLISREVYLTGAQIFGSVGQFGYNFGVTNGSLSNPADINNSSGAQFLGRISYTPFVGLNLGASFSSGTYLDKESVSAQLQDLAKSAEEFKQNAAGFDISYAIGHLVFFSELILNRWETPFVDEDLDAVAFYIEGKYTLFTRFYLAGRFSLIDFADINDPLDIDGDGKFRESWDYGVNQYEIGLGYRLSRNALIKFMGQFNRTKEALGGDPSDDVLAFQTVVFF